MRLPRILRTSTFRLALLYLALFSVSAFGLLGFIYWNTATFIAKQTDETIEAEITGLAEQYRLTGLAGLTSVVIERSRNQRASLYLLATAGRRPPAGHLDSWPDEPTDAAGWINFQYQRPVGGKAVVHHARARHLVLPDGFQLLVGRDVEERLNALVMEIPNIPDAATPCGADEHANTVREQSGEEYADDWRKPHYELGEALGIIDFERGTKLSGSRFYVLKGTGARLQRVVEHDKVQLFSLQLFPGALQPFAGLQRETNDHTALPAHTLGRKEDVDRRLELDGQRAFGTG